MKDAIPPVELRRRLFFKRTGAVVTGTTLGALTAHMAWGRDDGHHDGGSGRRRGGRTSTYGDLRRARDQNGDEIIALPKGFDYVTFSKTGDAFGDGLRVASRHDGMAAFDGPGGTIRLIRNHEVTAINAPFPVVGPAAKKYDTKGTGGCMTLDFDTKRKRLVRQFVSIAGTINNCSGGWSKGNGGWFTCEENTSGVNQGYDKSHGYVYFVPASADSAVLAVPIKGMGRFRHEGAVADDHGVVYLTEDAGNTSGFYRYTPNNSSDPHAGGVLEMLALADEPSANLFVNQTIGLRRRVSWVTIPVPDPDLEGSQMTCFQQGRAADGAAFNRLEGLFRGEDGRSMYFVSTSGGTVRGPDGDGYGQLWHYIPADRDTQEHDELVLVFESSSGKVLESPDNICVTPNGGLLFCEDDAVSDNDVHPLAPGIEDGNRLIGLGPKGEAFEFAVNLFSDSEFAGAVFSDDGEILFVNIQGGDSPGEGMTLAIWGPWDKGPL